jgi:hypothetical protein
MADEKILEEEVLDDAELENVAGGTLKETLDDRARLSKIGMYNFDNKKGFAGSVSDGFVQFGEKYGMKISVGTNLKKDGANQYFLNGKEVSREKLWRMINTLTDK